MAATSPDPGRSQGGGANAEVLAMRATGGLTSEDKGRFFRIMVAAAIHLGMGYLLGQFFLAPVHCGGPVYARWYQHLEFATVCSFVGMGAW
jgi:hypothetical protein